MLKMTKTWTVLLAVTALAVNVTPAMGDATWTGLGPTDNWSDMLNWKLADGVTWANGDPTAGGKIILSGDAAANTSIVDLDTSSAGANWGISQVHMPMAPSSALSIPTGAALDADAVYIRDGAIYVAGGFFGSDMRYFYNGLVEVSAGSWRTARWTYSSGGTLHIVGSPPDEGGTNGPTEIYMGDFMSWSANSTPTIHYTLDAGGVTPFTFGRAFMGHGPGDTGFATIEVDGIAAYLAGAGNSIGDTMDLIVATGAAGLEYPDRFTTGLVADGRGLVSLKDDGTGIELTILGGSIIPGDANDSGFVDDDDLAVLLSNWEQDPGTISTWALGDFTDDTDVDDDDLAVLLGNWTGPPPGGAAVPEPATLALLGLGGLSVLRRRRR